MGVGEGTLARLYCARTTICPVLSVVGLCCAALPARAQEPEPEGAPPEAAASSIRASKNVRLGRSVSTRFSLNRFLRAFAQGVAWDRERLPFNVSLRGNEASRVSVRMSVSRRNFSGVTFKVRF